MYNLDSLKGRVYWQRFAGGDRRTPQYTCIGDGLAAGEKFPAQRFPHFAYAWADRLVNRANQGRSRRRSSFIISGRRNFTLTFQVDSLISVLAFKYLSRPA